MNLQGNSLLKGNKLTIGTTEHGFDAYYALELNNKEYKNIRRFLIPYIDSYDDIRELTIVMNYNTKVTIENYLNAYVFDYLFGVKNA